MKIILLFAVLFAISLSTPMLYGQTTEEIPAQEPAEEVLIADKDTRMNVSLDKIQTTEELLLEEEEDLLYPADDLYGSTWNTRWVDPFRADTTQIVFPDTCIIDFKAFVMPILKDSVRVTSLYGPRRRRMHRGIDLKLQVGDTVYAVFTGKVRIRSFERRGYGNYLVVRHPNGLETVYGHLSKSLVEVNDIVRAGSPIALGGNTGRSTGSHLHFETRFLGQAMNPSDLIDFETGMPYQDSYVFRNIALNGRNTNIYTATEEQILYHIVKSGDTLGAIAARYGTSVGELRRMNGLSASATLRVGRALRCGIGKGGSAAIVAANKAEPKAAPKAKTATTPTVQPAGKQIIASAAVGRDLSEPSYYTIQAGDTLGSIAGKHGISVSRLCELNNITQTTILKVGRSIRCS
ncbi:MAG: peptidoglycan DD-metalloendopeptidase family protein [Tannerellaceae bacterium]|nr:peptidoglycan DD-metalloendopeptidase family protein [Tannerellaceae bacterium]